MTARASLHRLGSLPAVAIMGVIIVVGAGLVLGAAQFDDRQLWQTEMVQNGWRIDRHVLSPRCRLVDPDGQVKARHANGQCPSFLTERSPIVPAGGPDRHLVILLHGLGRSAASFRPMARALRDEGFEAVAVSYPSLKRSLSAHADQIAGIIDRAEGVTRVSFVSHSLGGIVVRELLARDQPWASRVEIGRVVMIAPPNQGSALARGLSGFMVFRLLAGPSAVALAGDHVVRLPPPRAQFGLIVGQASGRLGFNPWLDGNDDGIVRVAETWIAGSHDTLVLNAVHSFIMSDSEAVTATVRFLQTGQFRSNPIH